jgi:hypothetical protein
MITLFTGGRILKLLRTDPRHACVPRSLNPQAEHLLDWFHITMRITAMTNMAKSLPPPGGLATKVGKELERSTWFLWHGNVFHALPTVQDLETDLDVEEPSISQAKLLTAVRELGGYIQANTGRVPNYGERYRASDTISTAFVESAVNQIISKRIVKTADALDTPRSDSAVRHPPRHPPWYGQNRLAVWLRR